MITLDKNSRLVKWAFWEDYDFGTKEFLYDIPSETNLYDFCFRLFIVKPVFFLFFLVVFPIITTVIKLDDLREKCRKIKIT